MSPQVTYPNALFAVKRAKARASLATLPAKSASLRWIDADIGKVACNKIITRVGTQLAHQMIAATMRTAERKMSARLSYRVWMRRKSLRRQKQRSMLLRCLYAA